MTKPSKKDKLFFLDKLEEMFEHLPSYLQPKILNAVAFLYQSSKDEDKTAFARRVEILRDLRLGEFDILVGINLLREGLDLPEVGLVAILDADKEGFLRSEGSLIQTIGRAARNLEGKAILYTDKITGSIDRALAETNRRRDIQEKYNIENNITPKTATSRIKDVMEGARSLKKQKSETNEPADLYDVSKVNYHNIGKEIKKLEKLMKSSAKNLDFEEAARYRDLIKELKDKVLINKA